MAFLRSGFVMFLTLAACLATNAQAPADPSKVYKWLDANGFAYVANSRFIEYKVDWHRPQDKPYPQYGFLIAGSGDHFTVADPIQSSVSFPRLEEGQIGTATFKDGDFQLWADEQCKQYEKQTAYLTYGGFGALRAATLARACAAYHVPGLEKRFLDLASGVRDYEVLDRSDGLMGVLVVQNRKWREQQVDNHIADPDIPRSQTLDEVKRWLADYPDAVNAYMKDTKAVLEAMVKDQTPEPLGYGERTQLVPAKKITYIETQNVQVGRLIRDLRDIKRYQTSNPGDVYFAGGPFSIGNEPGDDAPGRLVKAGLTAVPQLIDALKDRSFTRSQRWARTVSAEVARVQDAAFQILGTIAHKDFDHDEDHDFHMTIPPTPDPDRSLTVLNSMRELFERRTKKIEKWWAEVQRDGEAAVLTKAIETGDPSFRGAAQRLAQIDAAHALNAISEGLKHEHPDVGTSDLVQSLAKLDWQAAAPIVKQQVTVGKNISTRLTAAEIEAKHDPEAAVQAMIAELRAYVGGKRARFDGFSDDPMGVIWFLAESQRLPALSALKEAMNSSEPLRYQVTEALCPYPSLEKNQEAIEFAASLSPAARTEFEKQVEDLLAGELQRTEQENGYMDRLCDAACDSMARNWPEKYKMQREATPGQKDAYCLAALNSWRADHHLPPVSGLHVSVVKAASDEEMKPLIDAVCSATDPADKAKAEAAVMAKGLPALPAVLKAQDRNPALKNLAMRLSCLVREIHVTGVPPSCGNKFLKDVLAIKGTSISSAVLSDLIIHDCQSWTPNVPGMSITGDREAYGEGFVLEVSFPGIDKANGSGGWVYSSDGAGGAGRDFNFGSFGDAFHKQPMEAAHFHVSVWHIP